MISLSFSRHLENMPTRFLRGSMVCVSVCRITGSVPGEFTVFKDLIKHLLYDRIDEGSRRHVKYSLTSSVQSRLKF